MNKKELHKIIKNLYIKALTTISSDVKDSLVKAYKMEETELAKMNLKEFLENAEICEKKGVPVCSDTGYPLWYVRIGEGALKWFHRQIPILRKVIVEETISITNKGKMRPNMIDPIDRYNPMTNVGADMPHIEWKFDDSSDVEITCVPKGGGTEIFLQSFGRTLLFADGIKGVKKFILDSVMQASLHGKACPPNIVGVGIGGTTDLCMKLAKEAAVLRPIGNRHPEARIAKLEEELLEAINMLGIGPLGMKGKITALDVHIEYAYTHLAGFPVGVAIQCPATRISTALITREGVQYKQHPNWFRRE
jgi:tartrate/fumarate subfamily iron-sulfur-dependent hydro-lyase alpha chain